MEIYVPPPKRVVDKDMVEVMLGGEINPIIVYYKFVCAMPL